MCFVFEIGFDCKNIPCRADCTINVKVVCTVKHDRASIDKAHPDQCQ